MKYYQWLIVSVALPAALWAARTISVEVTVPDAAWTIAIDEVHRVGDELWVVSTVSRDPDVMGAAVISTISDSVEIEAPDLPVKHYVLGKAWNWENEEAIGFIDGPEAIEAKLAAGTRLYPKRGAYLFSSFRGNGADGLHLAYSRDGLEWEALNGDRSFIEPQIGGKLMRDPCIVRGPDGVFHMVWTTSWTDRGIGVAHSEDLIEWSEQQFVPVMEEEETARNCWAPEINWDPEGEQYVIFWATTIPGKFEETAAAADEGWNHRMYYTTTKDFETYTPTRLLYEPGFNVIDSTIVRAGDRYVMVCKDETRHPPAKNLRVATSDRVTGPWSDASEPFTPEGLWVEGPTLLKVGDHWYVYYDAYTSHIYGAMRTRDFETWENVSDKLSVPEGMRHGTVLEVPENVLEKLLQSGGE